jgi:hypothetical protein
MTTEPLTPKRAVLQAVAAKKRLPELESVVLQNPIATCYYAKNVVKGRWEAAEPVIATNLSLRLVDFNILDEDTRISAGGYRVGPRPVGTGHVKSGNDLRLMTVYTRMVKCRVPAFEAALAGHRWKGDAYKYCQMIYRHTGELIDLDCPEVCSWMIRDLVFGRTFKKMPRAERIRVCDELHKRMILHSFAHGDNRDVRDYFAEQKKAENHMLLMMSQYDPDMKVGDLIQKVVEGL